MSSPLIALASTKGGAGKTTLAFLLATSISRRLCKLVACIDADPNATLDTVLRLYADSDILALRADAETLLQTIREAREQAALVVIDLEGSASQAMLYAIGKADLVLIPAQPSAFDVREASKTAAVVAQAADLVGREIPFRIVFTRTPVLRQRVAEHSREQFKRAGLQLLQVEIMERAAFREMTYSGLSPQRTAPDGAAAANIEAFTDAVLDLVTL
jgi:chromosome partitioning protein